MFIDLKAPGQQLAKIQANASFVIDYWSFLPFCMQFTITMAFLPQPTALKEWKRLLPLTLSVTLSTYFTIFRLVKKKKKTGGGGERKSTPKTMYRGLKCEITPFFGLKSTEKVYQEKQRSRWN